MSWINCNCGCRNRCTVAALIVSAIIGVLAAFFQITGSITVAPIFLWVALGIAVGFLGVVLLAGEPIRRQCTCKALSALLAGILGTVLFALIQLAFGIVATSVISAILTGLLLFSFALTLTAAACLIRCGADCTE